MTSGLLDLHAAVTEEHVGGKGHLAIDGTWSLHLAAAGHVSELVGRRGGWPRR